MCKRLGDAGVATVFDLLDLEDDKRRELLALPEQQLEEVAAVCARYPDINLSYEVVGGSTDVLGGESVALAVSLERELEAGAELQPVTAARFPGRRDEAWWLVVGDTRANTLLAIKRVVLQRNAKVKLEFSAPTTPGRHALTLYFMCDSYLGCDQEYELEVNVQEGGDQMEE
jgi:pre-mRNA-splicing helicase BRR2